VTGLHFELVPVEDTDAEALVQLRIAAMRDSLERIGRFDAQRARDRFLSGFVARHTRYIVQDGMQVGFVVVKPVDDGLLLDHLYVHPACQHRGIGSEVLRQILAEADGHGRCVRVGALKGSDANRFYVRHGFELVDVAEWDNYYVRRATSLDTSP
jgi:GNAT superfamily N-acetyltransferase